MMAGRAGFPRSIGTCPQCGKQSYLSRAQAKTAGRTINPAAHLSAYQCGEYWHFGKLSSTVARGYGSRAGSVEYPPALTRDIDILEEQRKVRERALFRAMSRGINPGSPGRES